MIRESNEAWAVRQVADLPPRWRGRLLGNWRAACASFDPRKVTGEGDALRRANAGLLMALASLSTAPLPLDVSDIDICAAAEKHAETCRKTAEETQHIGRDATRRELARFCITAGINAPGADMGEEPAILRMQCHLWWRRQLRRAQARAVEGSAIGLGYVHKGGDCYVSDESVQHRLQQNARNAAMLEATIARNELGQEFTLAELAAKSPANAAIKRAELMTRINGFERIAIDMAHAGVFFTLTAPSRMHAFKTVQGRAVRNRKYDGTKPNEAQAHHTKTWARIRAALARRGVRIYGFRIAEPNHDGTPHWHVLVFCKPDEMAILKSTVYRYALAVDGDEAGARKHRVDWKPMDPAKGTAAGYIAKYVAKNIDGHRLEKDLYGNEAIETSQRVEAWATRWRIRQFQQIGGPPVTVWRELRKVEAVPADSPSFVLQAHSAVNKVAVIEGRENASVAWDRYVKAQGGVFCGRGYRVRLATVAAEGVGRYGEERAPKVIGITFKEEYKVRDARGNWTDVRDMQTIVESKRFEWEIMRPATSAISSFGGAKVSAGQSTGAVDAEPDMYRNGSIGFVEGLDFGFERDEIAPWTCVNNCTGAVDGRVEGGGTQENGGARGGGNRSATRLRKDGGTKTDGFAHQHH
jgi:hypothetical protein